MMKKILYGSAAHLHISDIIQHFKHTDVDEVNYRYKVDGFAIHSETGDTLVIYTALYGDRQTYARPLHMFSEEVDRERYPEATQKYRFVKLEYLNTKDTCWYCGNELVWQGDDYIPDSGIVSKLSCTKCGAEVTYSWSR